MCLSRSRSAAAWASWRACSSAAPAGSSSARRAARRGPARRRTGRPAGPWQEEVLAGGDGAGVVGDGGGVARVGRVELADVVGVVAVGAAFAVGAGDAAHPPLAQFAPHPGPQQVGAAGRRVGVGLVTVAGAAVLGAGGLGGVPRGPVDDGGCAGAGDQCHCSGDGAAPAAAAEHLIPGVFRVAEDGGHAAEAPPGGRVGRGVGGRVGVEPGHDRVDPELAVGPPGVDLHHDGGPVRVQDQAGFGAALGGLERVGVRYPLGEVPVGDGAEVPAFARCALSALSRFFLSVAAGTIPRRLA